MFVPFHAQRNKWNKMEQPSAFLHVLAELGLALWQNLGLPFGSAVGLCPTVPLPIDRSEAAWPPTRSVAPTELRGVHIAGGCYKHFAPNGAMNPRLVQPNKLWDSLGTALGQLWDKLWDKQVY